MAEEIPRSRLFPSRVETLAGLRRKKVFDLAVLGGGLHGACFARLAALSGMSVLLLESEDYAACTASGARLASQASGLGPAVYQHFDYARSAHLGRQLAAVAPHLLVPVQTLARAPRPLNWQRMLLAIIDALSTKESRGQRVSRCGSASLPASLQKHSSAWPDGAVLCPDFLIKDARFVLENVLAARQEGAVCLNHAKLESVRARPDGSHALSFIDSLEGLSYEAVSGLVVNATGVDVASTGYPRPQRIKELFKIFRQQCFLFAKPWPAPSVFLPYGDKRGFWLHAHPSGTLVTSIPVQSSLEGRNEAIGEADRQRAQSLIAEFSPAGESILLLDAWTESFIQPLQGKPWLYAGRLLNLLGASFAEAYHTVEAGYREFMRIASVTIQYQSLWGRKLPGGGKVDMPELQSRAAEFQLDPLEVDRLVRRYGGKAIDVLVGADAGQRLGDGILQGEVNYAREVEQAETEDDILRRLEILHLPANTPGLVKRLSPSTGTGGEIKGAC